MVVIKNNLDEEIVINLPEGENKNLLAKGILKVTKEELASPHIQELIEKGNISVSTPKKKKVNLVPRMKTKK